MTLAPQRIEHMKVLACFGKFLPNLSGTSDVFHAVAQFCGVYASAALVFTSCDGTGVLSVFDISVHSKTYEEGKLAADAPDLGVLFDFLDLGASPEEYSRLLTTCRACVAVRKPYNYRDVFLYNFPFREPVEKSLFDAPSLFDAQAVILILRECLARAHPLHSVVHGLHSRTTMATLLYENLSIHATPVSAHELASIARHTSPIA